MAVTLKSPFSTTTTKLLFLDMQLRKGKYEHVVSLLEGRMASTAEEDDYAVIKHFVTSLNEIFLGKRKHVHKEQTRKLK